MIADCLDSCKFCLQLTCKGNNWDPFADRIKLVNNVVVWIKAREKELEISRIFDNQNSCEIFEINREYNTGSFLYHPVSNHVRVFASVEDLQYTLTDFYLIIVDFLDSSLPSLPGNLLKAKACRSLNRPLTGLSPYLGDQCYRVQWWQQSWLPSMRATCIPSLLLAECSNQEL